MRSRIKRKDIDCRIVAGTPYTRYPLRHSLLMKGEELNPRHQRVALTGIPHVFDKPYNLIHVYPPLYMSFGPY